MDLEVHPNNFIHILMRIDTQVTQVRGLDRLEYYVIASPAGEFISNEKKTN